jgi:hypothetical protein
MWRVTYHWKALDEVTTFLKLHVNKRFAQKVMGLQSPRSPHFKKFETSKLGVLGQNDIWVLALWTSTKNTIREKVVASRKFKSW